jgi:hypothetical protein
MVQKIHNHFNLNIVSPVSASATAPSAVFARPAIPLASSTPKSKCKDNKNQNDCNEFSTQVALTVKSHSKTIKRELTGELAVLGKAMVHGSTDPDKIARAVIKNNYLCNYVENLVIQKLSSQLNELCARKNPLLLRQTDKDALLNFNFLNSDGMESNIWLCGFPVAGSVLLKQINPQMCVLQCYCLWRDDENQIHRGIKIIDLKIIQLIFIYGVQFTYNHHYLCIIHRRSPY